MTVSNQFLQQYAWCENRVCAVPIQVAGASQRGRLGEHANNQDAIALWATDTCVVGIVCDGCGSSADGPANSEVGAILSAKMIAEVVSAECVDKGVAGLPARFHRIEKAFGDRVLKIAGKISPHDRGGGIRGYFMTTIVGFAIDALSYCIFGVGDGMFAVDGRVVSLEGNAGEYFATQLLNAPAWKKKLASGTSTFRTHQEGRTQDVHSILVGSDGFEDLARLFPGVLSRFLRAEAQDDAATGVDPAIVAEFRREVWNSAEVRGWRENEDGHDDRSFIFARGLKPARSQASTFAMGAEPT